jgi:hypothetical protein
MLLPWILLLICLTFAIIVLILNVRRKVQEHTHHRPPR